MTDPTDRKPRVPVQRSPAILNIVVQRHTPAQTPAGGQRQLMEPEDPPLHQPSAAECYGCVEWFPF